MLTGESGKGGLTVFIGRESLKRWSESWAILTVLAR